jgi:uncharacterized membrane protein (Fun14 family)
VNRFLRDNGFGVALVLGVALLVVGLVAGNPAALVIAVLMLVIGVSARPLEQFALNRSGFLLKWQREAVQKLQQRLEGRLGFSGSLETKVIRGTGATTAPAQTASGRGHANAAAAIARPQSPDEFAETLIEQVIEPAFIASEERVNAPTVEQGHPKPPGDAQSDALTGG